MQPRTRQLASYDIPRNRQRTGRLLSTLLMLAVLPLWPSLSFAGVEAILTDDAYTSSSDPVKKFGKTKGLLVSKKLRSFLKFKLSTLPSGTIGADIEKATLKIFVSKLPSAGSFHVFAVTGPWSEGRISHRTAPVLAHYAETGTPVSVRGVNQFVTVDLTTLVRDWVDFIATSGATGRSNNGIALVRHSDLSAEIDSKESDSTAHDAALEIVLAGGGVVGPAGPIGPAGAAGPKGDTGPRGPIGLTGATGATGAKGATGAAGPAGPTGPAGSPSVSGLELVTATSASNGANPKTQTVSCPGGKKALGGGGSIVPGGLAKPIIQISRPSGGSPATAWSVTGFDTGLLSLGISLGNWSVAAYVICATVP